MIALAREKGLFLMEAMWTRFTPAMAKIRELIAAGAIGEVRMLQARFRLSRQVRPDDPRVCDLALGGGAVLDVGVYPISLASMIFGEPAQILSAAHLGATGVDEQNAIMLRLSGGADGYAVGRRPHQHAAGSGDHGDGRHDPHRLALVATARFHVLSGPGKSAGNLRPAVHGQRLQLRGGRKSGAACARANWRARSCRWTRRSRSCRRWTRCALNGAWSTRRRWNDGIRKHSRHRQAGFAAGSGARSCSTTSDWTRRSRCSTACSPRAAPPSITARVYQSGHSEAAVGRVGARARDARSGRADHQGRASETGSAAARDASGHRRRRADIIGTLRSRPDRHLSAAPGRSRRIRWVRSSRASTSSRQPGKSAFSAGRTGRRRGWKRRTNTLTRIISSRSRSAARISAWRLSMRSRGPAAGVSREQAQPRRRDWYAEQQMPLFSWSSLAGGFMTGRFRRDNLDSFTERHGFDDCVALTAARRISSDWSAPSRWRARRA